MARGAFGLRGLSLIVLATVLCACAGSDDAPRPGMDGGHMDGAMGDGATGDGSGGDAGADAGTDAGTDAGPETTARTCEACEVHDDCATGSFCVTLSVGGRACVPSCVPDIPTCPRAFSCVLDVASGVDTTVCLPVGGACCVDEDADTYGLGVGCMGADCNDLDETINPGVDEICDGVDQDCDGTPDDPPTDCGSGRCADEGDGTYGAVTGATCTSAMCVSGSTTDCALFTCEDGGEAGTRCATSCAPAGTDDDTFCIAAAHCDAGDCATDVPNGMACDEDGDCIAGHCDNGFCCDTGTCCSVTGDCPGGGGVATVCENSMTCQGTRGETECTAEFQCRTTSGIPDDTACDDTTLARDCGLYDPVYCTGATDQPPPECPTSCLGDLDCIDAAHCEFGFCVPDRPPGSSCSRPQDCQDGLSCVDGVCCTSPCTGTCQACNLAGSLGSCVNIPAGADPSGECPGVTCATYYTGFSGGGDVCYRRQDASDAAATCNGAAMCIDSATLCSAQPPGPVQVDCNDVCQSPVAGTCTGTTPGACTNLDDPADTTTCGTGACARTVQRCTGGTATTCTPGTPTAETCNGADDDCDSRIDEGTSTSLCPSAPFVETYVCSGTGTCAIGSCVSGRHDLNTVYSDGCECLDDAYGNACAALTSLGNMSPGSSMAVNGVIVPDGEEDWFTVNFPNTARGPGEGNPQIRLTGTTASNFVLDFFTSCGSSMSCGSGTGTAVGAFSFVDDQSSGLRAYTGPHSVPWPTTVVFRVRRVITTTSCADASYTVTLSR